MKQFLTHSRVSWNFMKLHVVPCWCLWHFVLRGTLSILLWDLAENFTAAGELNDDLNLANDLSNSDFVSPSDSKDCPWIARLENGRHVQLGQEMSRVTDSQSMVKAMSQRFSQSERPPDSVAGQIPQEFTVKLQKLPGMRCSRVGEPVSRAVESSVAVGRSKMEGIWRNVYRMLNPFRLCETLISIIDLILGKGIGRSDGNSYRLGVECVQFVRNPAGGWPVDILRLFDLFLFPYSFITFHRSETFRTRSMF